MRKARIPVIWFGGEISTSQLITVKNQNLKHKGDRETQKAKTLYFNIA
jgi:hypothetical protein